MAEHDGIEFADHIRDGGGVFQGTARDPHDHVDPKTGVELYDQFCTGCSAPFKFVLSWEDVFVAVLGALPAPITLSADLIPEWFRSRLKIPDETQFYRWSRTATGYQIYAPCRRCFGRLETAITIDKLRSYVPFCEAWPVLADEHFDEPPTRATRLQLDVKYAALTVSNYLKYERVQNPRRPLPPLRKTMLAHVKARFGL
jgi:hypothetical protein